MKRQKENKKIEKGRNEINRGPSKNKTHKTKRKNKVSRERKLCVINKQKQKNKKHTLVVTRKNRKT